jgi:cytochrome c peroxidase
VNGFKLFVDPKKGNCAICHSAPNFTDNGFHNIGLKADNGARIYINDKVVIDSFRELWTEILTHNLYLGRREISKRWISPIVRQALRIVATELISSKISKFG